MMHFTVLEHHHPRGLHWDLLLEVSKQYKAPLKAWALDAPPDSQEIIYGCVLPDHRSEYLNYEGDITENRGYVIRWDSGIYSTYPGKSVSDDRNSVCYSFLGSRLNGICEIQLIPVQDETDRKICFINREFHNGN